jgi:hypothetical protein
MNMFAGLDGLIGLVVFVVIAIIASFLKRKEEEPFEIPPELKQRRDQPPPPPPPRASQSRPVARNWEEELRKLLGETPALPPVVRQPPPPLPPVRPVARPYVAAPEPEDPHIQVALPAPNPRVKPAFQTLPGLTDSDARYAGASHLQERVAHQLAEVSRHRVGTTSVERRAASVETREVVTMLREPAGMRHAVLASVILGPPRALEP